jgi:hypothetical protein
MTARLFIGGLRDGLWVDIPKDRHYWRVPVPPKIATFAFLADPLAECEPGYVTYVSRRTIVPGWRIPLTFYVIDGGDPFTERGYVLPGFVVGVRPEQSSLLEKPQT